MFNILFIYLTISRLAKGDPACRLAGKHDKRSALETSGGSDIRFFVGGDGVSRRRFIGSLHARGKKRIQTDDAIPPHGSGWPKNMPPQNIL